MFGRSPYGGMFGRRPQGGMVRRHLRPADRHARRRQAIAAKDRHTLNETVCDVRARRCGPADLTG